MSIIKITFTDEADFTRDLDAFCEAYNYDLTQETKEEFLIRLLKEHVRETSRSFRRQKAINELIID